MCFADHLLQSSSGISQIVSLSFKQTLMLFEVTLTVRVQTHQTGLDGFVFSSSTDVTLHISSSSVTVSRKFSLLQFLHQFSQNGVFAQSRSWTEGLSALRAAVDSLLILLIPAVCNTDLTVTVSTGSGHWILQEIQTHCTQELILRKSGFCHFTAEIQRHKHTTAQLHFSFSFPEVM